MHDETDFGYPTPDQTARYWAAVCHAGAILLLVVPGGGFLVALLLWYFKRDASDYIDMHGREAVNFQLSAFLVFLVLSGLSAMVYFTCLGFLAATVITAFLFIVGGLAIVGAFKALQGEPYRYPLALRFF